MRELIAKLGHEETKPSYCKEIVIVIKLCELNISESSLNPLGSADAIFESKTSLFLTLVARLPDNSGHACLSAWTGPGIFRISEQFVILYK